jgi:outer membrane receptor for ferrienterochelin and colicins
VTSAFITPEIEAPGYHTLDFRLSRTLIPELEGYVGVLDVLDIHRDPFRIGDQRPIAGRTFYLGVLFSFPEAA